MKAKSRYVLFSAAALLMAALLAGCGAQEGGKTAPEPTERVSLPPADSGGIASQAPVESASAPETPAPTPIPTPVPTPALPEPAVTLPPDKENVPLPVGDTAAAVGAYLPVTVPASAPVGDEYFADAVFIGDSRTEGFRMYSGITNARYYSAVSLSVDKVFTEPVVTSGGQSLTVAQALESESYGKAYIMFGVNELGWGSEQAFADYYGRIVDTIRLSNPSAVIYVQSILPVSALKDGSGTVYTNANVVRFQKAIAQMCVAKGVNYLNVAEAVQDADGCLPYDATPDGVHLTPEYICVWADYLRTHTV